MDGTVTCSTLIILLLSHCLCPDSSATRAPITETNKPDHKERPGQFAISTTQRDITTPITTVPTIIPTMPITTTPIVNPTSTPDSISPAMTTPSFSPTTPSAAGSSWCIASQSASQTALQLALDYACGAGGADCAAIQLGGSCYNPNSVRDHASYAFNSYYQKNPLPNSCNFGGTAVITSTNPSTGTCQYPSTSTSSSVLNTTNSSGSTVFGAVPTRPSTSPAPNSDQFPSLQSFFLFTTLLFIASAF